MAVEYEIASDIATLKGVDTNTQLAHVVKLYTGAVTYDDEASSKYATVTIDGKSQRVMLCIAVSGNVAYDDVPSKYSTVDGHRCLNIVEPTGTEIVDDVPSVYETITVDGKNVRAIRCVLINQTPVYDGVSSTCTFVDSGKTHTAQLVNVVSAGAIEEIVKGVSPLSLPDAVADGLKYVKAFGDCETRNLPEGYQELEYIEGHNNAQYINTGIVPTSSMSMYFKGQFVSVDSSTPAQGAFLMGTRDVSGQYGLFLQITTTNVSLDWFAVNSRWSSANTRAVGDVVEMKVSNSLAQIWVNGSSVGTHQYTPDDTTQYPLFLNALNNIGRPFDTNVNVVNRIYRFTITGIADMRPARRLSDGVLGMYDTIRKRFFTNAGTGSFTAGIPLNALPDGYTQLEYIESTGTQWINTGFIANNGMILDCKVQPIDGASYIGSIDDSGSATMADTSRNSITYASSAYYPQKMNDYNRSYSDPGTSPAVIHLDTTGTKFYCTINGNTAVDTTTAGVLKNQTTTVKLGFSDYTQSARKGRYYYVQIKNSADAWVCNLVPAKRNSDSAIGMYDTVSNTFFTNQGTGTFTAGGVITPTPSKPADIWCNNGAIKAIRPIKYLESTGTQYIDTGVLPTLNTKLVVKATRIAVGGFAGSRDGADANSTMMAFATNGTSVIIDFNNGNNVPYRINHTIGTGIITIIAESSKDARRLYDENGTLLAENTTVCSDTFTATKNMTLFNCNGGSISGGCRIYYAQIWDGDTLIRDFIPALDMNNIPCMYDKVEGKCYYNAGTGQFIAGYLPAEYEELEYIQGYCSDSSDSTIKASYIDTGIILPANANFYLKSQLASSPTTNSYLMCGTRTAVYAGSEIYVGSANTVIDWYGSAEADRLTIGVGGSTGDIYEIYGNNKTLTVFKNGSNIGSKTFSSPTTPTLTFWLNSRNTNNQVTSQTAPTLGGIYRFTVAGVCDMIPARKRSNGHVGMYDLVRRQFFENAGEGQFTVGKLPILPDGYTQLDYIEGTGTQWIDTGVKATGGAVIEAKGKVINNEFYIGSIGTTADVLDTTRNLIIYNSATTALRFQKKDAYGATRAITINPANDFIVKLDTIGTNLIGAVDGVIGVNETVSALGTQPQTIKVFNNDWDGVRSGRVYWCKLYSNTNMLVRYLIPAKRNSDGVVGMYDIMNDVFLTNQGTGDFEYGAEIPTETFDGYYVDGDVETIATKAGGSTLSTATCENLLGIGSTQDVQEILTGIITRKVGIKVLTGDEVWFKAPNATSLFGTRLCEGTIETATPGLSTHFIGTKTGNANMADGSIKILTASTAAPGYISCYIKANLANDNLTTWMTWLRQQYDNGTPVIVVYPLSADETESVAGQTLTVSAGNNTAEILQASIDNLELEVKYMKGV